MMKRTISWLLAAAIVLSFAPVCAADPAATTPEVTVVGKRIKNDNNYFEISLEVNGDYDDYSSVGVVLRYDPNYIVPAESWDDGAGAADMSANTSWSTRRALPTLSADNWSAHTALAYEAAGSETDATKKYGYLYLGAEHTPEDNSSSSGGTTDPTPEPDPTDPHSNPILAVRFMYAGSDLAARRTTKANLISAWTTAWDDDWTKNSILTIANDKVSGASAAQYGFAYYGSDYSERVFMYNFPSTAPSPTPTTVRQPYTPSSVGSAVADANKLTKDNIEIVTCEGKTAKSGGLSLNDIFVILFFDWDDSLLGTLTAGVGDEDTENSVNEYIRDSFVYPDLRMTADDIQSKKSEITKRQNNYRGEYPYTAPNASAPLATGGANTVTDGGDYPLTNKLDYCFGGVPLAAEWGYQYPYAAGWTLVADTSNMSDTFTALESGQTFTRAVTYEEDGTTVKAKDDDGNDLPTTTPYMASYNFGDMDQLQSDVDTYGNLYLKAVYTPGEMLNRQNTSNISYEYNYVTLGPLKTGTIGVSSATLTTFSIEFQYIRVNKYGYGVYRLREPGVNMALTQVGASASTPIGIFLDSKEVMDVMLTPTNAVSTVGYQLRETYNDNVVSGGNKSVADELGIITVSGADGLGFHVKAAELLTKGKSSTAADFSGLFLTANTNGTAYNILTLTTGRNNLFNLASKITAAGDSYDKITWYQLQYGLLNAGNYVSADTAYDWINGYPKLVANADKL